MSFRTAKVHSDTLSQKSKESLGHNVIERMERGWRSHAKLKVQGLGAAAQISPRWKGSKWSLRKNIVWQRKVDELPEIVTDRYGYFERRYFEAVRKLSSSYSEPTFSSGHLIFPQFEEFKFQQLLMQSP